MRFKQWLEKTLYHGTVIDNADTIKKYGLQGGWHGPLGSFVAQHYGGEEYGKPTEDDEIVFATDKERLGKAVTAMVHHISVKLNKSFHDVTDNDIRNHGLLVIVKEGDSSATQAPEEDYWGELPRGVEPGDYFANSMSVDVLLRGSALIRFLTRMGEWPRDWGEGDRLKREKTTKGKTTALEISRSRGKNPRQLKLFNKWR